MFSILVSFQSLPELPNKPGKLGCLQQLVCPAASRAPLHGISYGRFLTVGKTGGGLDSCSDDGQPSDGDERRGSMEATRHLAPSCKNTLTTSSRVKSQWRGFASPSESDQGSGFYGRYWKQYYTMEEAAEEELAGTGNLPVSSEESNQSMSRQV